jgi:hypothetical protein
MSKQYSYSNRGRGSAQAHVELKKLNAIEQHEHMRNQDFIRCVHVVLDGSEARISPNVITRMEGDMDVQE